MSEWTALIHKIMNIKKIQWDTIMSWKEDSWKKLKDILEDVSSLNSQQFFIILEAISFLWVNILSPSVLKLVTCIQLPTWYFFYWLFKDKSKDEKRKGRIKYEMQVFVRGFNSRLRIIKSKQEIIVRETQAIKNEKQAM